MTVHLKVSRQKDSVIGCTLASAKTKVGESNVMPVTEATAFSEELR